jgi:hypothetical protein
MHFRTKQILLSIRLFASNLKYPIWVNRILRFSIEQNRYWGDVCIVITSPQASGPFGWADNEDNDQELLDLVHTGPVDS